MKSCFSTEIFSIRTKIVFGVIYFFSLLFHESQKRFVFVGRVVAPNLVQILRQKVKEISKANGKKRRWIHHAFWSKYSKSDREICVKVVLLRLNVKMVEKWNENNMVKLLQERQNIRHVSTLSGEWWTWFDGMQQPNFRKKKTTKNWTEKNRVDFYNSQKK